MFDAFYVLFHVLNASCKLLWDVLINKLAFVLQQPAADWQTEHIIIRQKPRSLHCSRELNVTDSRPAEVWRPWTHGWCFSLSVSLFVVSLTSEGGGAGERKLSAEEWEGGDESTDSSALKKHWRWDLIQVILIYLFKPHVCPEGRGGALCSLRQGPSVWNRKQEFRFRLSDVTLFNSVVYENDDCLTLISLTVSHRQTEGRVPFCIRIN